MAVRVIILGIALTAALAAAVLKVASLSVVNHDVYAALELDLRSSEQLVPARRGDILDARGRVLATDRPSFDVAVIPALLPTKESTYEDFRYIRQW